MKKQSTFVKIIRKIFLKETVIKADGKEVRGLTVFGYVIIIFAIAGALVILELAGVIDDAVTAFGKKPHTEGRR